MQNQENTEVKKLSKQEYNRLYYQKNKDRRMNKKKERPYPNVFHLFTKAAFKPLPTTIPIRQWVCYLNWLELFLLVALVGIMTTFLIREAANFYLDVQEGPLSAYLKAGLLEGVAILFSLSRSNQVLLKWAQRIAVVMLCSFTLVLMSGKLMKTAVGDTFKVQAMKQNLQQLESELSQKEELRNQFLNKGRLTVTRNYERGVDQIRNKIIAARRELSTMQSPQIIASGLSILISFRLLLVIANLICIHRIVEKVGAQFWINEGKNRVES